MSLDLSWLWNTLNSVVGSIESFFGSLWEQIQGIANTGQGLFAGLSVLGSTIWNAIVQFANWIYQGLVDAWNLIQQGLNVLGEWFWKGLDWIGSGVSWIGSQLYNFGNWLYNGFWYIINLVANAIEGLWNTLVNWFYGIGSYVWNWVNTVTHTVNTWFTNIMIVFRQKFIQTIFVDFTIYQAWKSAERLVRPSNTKDIGFGLFGLLTSPITGYLVAKIIDIVVPKPSTNIFPVLPEMPKWEYKPPELTITRPSEKIVPPRGRPERFYSPIRYEAIIGSEYKVSWLPAKSKEVELLSEYLVGIFKPIEQETLILSEYSVSLPSKPLVRIIEAIPELKLKGIPIPSKEVELLSEYETSIYIPPLPYHKTHEIEAIKRLSIHQLLPLTSTIGSEYLTNVVLPKEISLSSVISSEYLTQKILPVSISLSSVIGSEYSTELPPTSPSGTEPNDPTWTPTEGWDEICQFDVDECGYSFTTSNYIIEDNMCKMLFFNSPDGNNCDIYKGVKADKIAFAVRFRHEGDTNPDVYRRYAYGISHDDMVYVVIEFRATPEVKLYDKDGNLICTLEANKWYVFVIDYVNQHLTIYDKDKNVIYDGNCPYYSSTLYTNQIMWLGVWGGSSPYSGTYCELYWDIDWIAVKYTPASPSGLDPNDPTWCPSEGWDKVWQFDTEDELNDFANYENRNTYVENSLLKFNPPAGDYGEATNRNLENVATRIAVCLKVSAISGDYVDPFGIHSDDGNRLYTVDLYAFHSSNELMLYDDIGGNSVTFNNPNDYIVIVFDRSTGKATVYDKNKNVLAELQCSYESGYWVEQLIITREYNNYNSWTTDVEVDWVAVKY